MIITAGDTTTYTETEMTFWRNFRHRLHRKLSKWKLPVHSVTKMLLKWQYFRFSVIWNPGYPTLVLYLSTATTTGSVTASVLRCRLSGRGSLSRNIRQWNTLSSKDGPYWNGPQTAVDCLVIVILSADNRKMYSLPTEKMPLDSLVNCVDVVIIGPTWLLGHAASITQMCMANDRFENILFIKPLILRNRPLKDAISDPLMINQIGLGNRRHFRYTLLVCNTSCFNDTYISVYSWVFSF